MHVNAAGKAGNCCFIVSLVLRQTPSSPRKCLLLMLRVAKVRVSNSRAVRLNCGFLWGSSVAHQQSG